MTSVKQFKQGIESQAIPENRFGTRSFTGYAKFQLRGNVVGMSKLLRARPRMQKKVRRLIEQGLPMPAQGKIIRASYRDMVALYDNIPAFLY